MRVSPVSGEIVAALAAAACERIEVANIARMAAFNAVRLAEGRARAPAGAVAVSAGVWLPLSVPVSPADVCWRPLPAVSVLAEGGRVEADGGGAESAGLAAVEADERGVASEPAPLGEVIAPETGEQAPSAVAEPAQETVEAAGRASGEVDDTRPTAAAVDKAFAFRPGDRVLPDPPAGQRVHVEARPEPLRPSLASSLSAPAGGLPDGAHVAAGSAVRETTTAAMVASMPAAVGGTASVAAEAADAMADRERAANTASVRRSWGGHVRRAVRWVGMALAVWFAAMLALIVLFRFVDPPGSTLIAWQALTGTSIERQWVPLSRISRNLQHAVIVSEDGRFCRHWGIDPREVAAAIRRARDGVPRGASTITMQLAKNLFLWPSKSYLRKVLEVPLTLALELVWPKERILEVYLNIVEWGPGVFGAEAAARHHFNKSAQRLSQQEAALLAVSLPNPISRDAGDPGRGTRRLASIIVSRMRSAGDAANCIGRGQ